VFYVVMKSLLGEAEGRDVTAEQTPTQ
jgi:hypothetical protein